MSNTIGLEQNQYYWCHHPEGTRFVAKLENDHWWIIGQHFAINITQDQIIHMIKPPEN